MNNKTMKDLYIEKLENEIKNIKIEMIKILNNETVVKPTAKNLQRLVNDLNENEQKLNFINSEDYSIISK